jgi:uroporphyrinogen decarboxylase
VSKNGDLIDAFNCRQPKGAVPIWELHFHLWEKVSGEKFISGAPFNLLSTAEKDKALEKDAEIILSVADKLNFSAVTIPDSPWDCIYTLPFDARLKLASILSRQASDVMIIAGCGAVIGMPDSDEYVDFCYRLFDAPEEIDEICKKKFSTGSEQAKMLADAGVGAIYTASDLADNHGPFFNPSQMQRYVLPYLREWSELVKKLGVFPLLHTDGNIKPILNDLADSGICAIQAIDPIAGMDILQVKKEVGGRLCLCGNVDCGLLITGTPEEVYDSTVELIKSCKKGGGFVLGSSNAVVTDTPLENYLALIRAWNECGSY